MNVCRTRVSKIVEAEKGYHFISTSDDHDVIAGQVNNMRRVMRKPVFGVSDQVRHKPGSTTTEDDWMLEFSDLGSRGILLSK